MEYTDILAKISPSLEEESAIQQATSMIVDALELSAKNHEVDIVVTPGGSTAKGTYLKGNFDIDIFVRFKSTHASFSQELELLLSGIAADKGITIERVHGSRDYFTFPYEGFFFELVPVKYVESDQGVENVTDMSPLHVLWIKEKLTPSLQNDIRLAKQWCKSIGIYGAESYINGLSGHVLDILLVYYGSFDEWIQAVSSWSGVTVIDSNNVHDDVFSSLNQSKLVSPLIVVDPVDVQRNAAAALSQEKYDLLISQASLFVEKPSSEFFTIPTFEKQTILDQKQDGEVLILISVSSLDGKKDVVATKILKTFEFLKRHIQLYEFSMRDAQWFYQEHTSYLYFYVDAKDLEEEVLRCGPPVSLSEDVEKFKEVHPETFEQDGRICTYVKREFTSIRSCVDHLAKAEYVQSRVKDLSLDFL